MFYIGAVKHFQCRGYKCRINKTYLYKTWKHAYTYHQGEQRQSNTHLQNWISSQEFNSCFATLPLTLKFSLMLNCDTVTVVGALFWKETVKFSPASGLVL